MLVSSEGTFNIKSNQVVLHCYVAYYPIQWLKFSVPCLIVLHDYLRLNN